MSDTAVKAILVQLDVYVYILAYITIGILNCRKKISIINNILQDYISNAKKTDFFFLFYIIFKVKYRSLPGYHLLNMYTSGTNK